MGLRDRDYTHDDFMGTKKRRFHQSGGVSVVLAIIFINVALWLANGIMFKGDDLTKTLSLHQQLVETEPTLHAPTTKPASFLDPATCYRYITYGFVHSPVDIWHITFNMLGLLMFGYGMMLGIGPGGFGFVRGDNVEGRLGRMEFAVFYLMTILVGGIVFAATNFDVDTIRCLGASGGVCGVIILYAWLFPQKTLLLYGIIPLPMWAIGVLIVVMDATGAAGHSGEGGIAYSVHLGGAACGTLYYFLFLRQGLTLTDWLHSPPRSKRNTKLHVHSPPKNTAPKPNTPEDEFSHRLDEILKRYGEVGESGLTAEERAFLQQASQRFAEKHRNR